MGLPTHTHPPPHPPHFGFGGLPLICTVSKIAEAWFLYCANNQRQTKMWDMQDKNQANSSPTCCAVHFANALLAGFVHFV